MNRHIIFFLGPVETAEIANRLALPEFFCFCDCRGNFLIQGLGEKKAKSSSTNSQRSQHKGGQIINNSRQIKDVAT